MLKDVADFLLCDEMWVLPPAAYVKVNKETEVDKTDITRLEIDCSNPYYYCFLFLSLDGALRRLMHTEVCIRLDTAHFLSLMYGFIMQPEHL